MKTFLLKTLGLGTILTIAQVASACESLQKTLNEIPKDKVKVFLAVEGDGKLQTIANIEKLNMLKSLLSKFSGEETINFYDYVDGFVGLSSGAAVVAPLAIGVDIEEISEKICSMESKLNVSAGCFTCCRVTRGLTSIASAYVGSVGSDIDLDQAEYDNQYDAFVQNQNFIVTMSALASGSLADYKKPVNILTLNEGNVIADRVISAIKERDTAAKVSSAKFMFSNVLDAAKVVTKVAQEIGKENIDQSAASKALEIMEKADANVAKLSDALRKTLLAQNIMFSLQNPTAESPILLIDMNSDTANGSSVNTCVNIDKSEHMVSVLYTTKIPADLYPKTNTSFEVSKNAVSQSVKADLGRETLENSKILNELAKFLVERKTSPK